MRRPRTLRVSMCLTALWAAASLLAACGPQGPRLRVTNSGAQAIQNLTVLFPEGEVAFGDVPAGATTEYQPVPNGVYRFAAYRFEVDGQEVTQRVRDWVGEEPLGDGSYTYTVDFDPTRLDAPPVQLLDVTQD